jgi:hypothetical protein
MTGRSSARRCSRDCQSTSSLPFFEPVSSLPGDFIASLDDNGQVAPVLRRIWEPHAARNRLARFVLVESEVPSNAEFLHTMLLTIWSDGVQTDAKGSVQLGGGEEACRGLVRPAKRIFGILAIKTHLQLCWQRVRRAGSNEHRGTEEAADECRHGPGLHR